MLQYSTVIICLDQFKLFGSQSLKAAVVSVAAGLRHSLAVTGNSNNGACLHERLNPQFLFIVSYFQTQALCISGASVSWVRLREHSVRAPSPHTSALLYHLWYQVSSNVFHIMPLMIRKDHICVFAGLNQKMSRVVAAGSMHCVCLTGMMDKLLYLFAVFVLHLIILIFINTFTLA